MYSSSSVPEPSAAGDVTNPSYQNYLAKQLLADTSHHSFMPMMSMPQHPHAVLVPPPGHGEPETNPEEISRLSNLLDRIESHTQNELDEESNAHAKVDSVEAAAAASSNVVQSASPSDENPLEWSKLYDSNTGYFYYANARTGVTQWECPPNFVEPEVQGVTQPPADMYTAHAHFNTKTGRFTHSGTESYWSKVGRPEDREGRQMSAFFDIGQLDANRQEAKEKKQKLLEKKGMDWRKYKEERKKKRQKIQYRWLYEET